MTRGSTQARVVVALTVLRPEEKALVQALREAGAEVQIAVGDDVGDLLASVERPGTVLVRRLSHADALDTARRFEAAGWRTVNSPRSIETCGDKGLQALLFRVAEIPHPATSHAYSVEQVWQHAHELGWPVVIKPVNGSWGRGVCCLTEQGLDAWVSGRESVDPQMRAFPVLVQQNIEKPGFDLRVVVVGTEPVAAIRRSSDGWSTNTSRGARIEAVEVTPRIRHLIEEVTGIVGPGIFGVDLLQERGTDQLFVLEVNANPDFARSSAVHGVDVARHMAAYAIAMSSRMPTLQAV